MNHPHHHLLHDRHHRGVGLVRFSWQYLGGLLLHVLERIALVRASIATTAVPMTACAA